MATLSDIVKAKERINPFIHETPVVWSTLLNKWLGHEIFFKAECLQKIGAFKARGACNAIAWYINDQSRPKRVIANSSGNHAQAVAWAATQFGVPSTIYMPAYSSKVKIEATKSYGAAVDLSENRNVADEKVKEAAKEPGIFWVPPFNHEQVIAGQGTAAFEALRQVDHIDAVFAPCGGGGLLSGTLIATHGTSPRTQVIGAEPLNANDAAQSLKMNAIQKLPAVPDTIADGAMTMSVGNITFEYLKKLDHLYEIEEQRIIYWAQWLSHLLKLHIEPTSALGMEAAFRWLNKQKTKKRIMVILSGGNIDQETQLKIWNRNYLDAQPVLKPNY